MDVSFACATVRTIAKPNDELAAGLNRSCENGMRNSARQPCGLFATATSQTASQLVSLLLSLNQ